MWSSASARSLKGRLVARTGSSSRCRARSSHGRARVAAVAADASPPSPLHHNTLHHRQQYRCRCGWTSRGQAARETSMESMKGRRQQSRGQHAAVSGHDGGGEAAIAPQPEDGVFARLLAKETNVRVKQGGRLSVHVGKGRLLLDTSWSDECHIAVYGRGVDEGEEEEEQGATSLLERLTGLRVEVLPGGAGLRLRDPAGSDQSRGEGRQEVLVKVSVPYIFNVAAETGAGDIRLVSKLKGDATLRTGKGGVRVPTIRGPQIEISCKGGSIEAKELEGNIHLRAEGGGISAKLLNGPSVTVCGAGCEVSEGEGRNGIDIGGMYATRSFVSSNGHIDIGSLHGQATVASTSAALLDGQERHQGTNSSSSDPPASAHHSQLRPVTIGSVSGSVCATAEGPLTVHLGKLALGTATTLTSSQSDVNVSLTEEVGVHELRVECREECTPSCLDTVPTFKGEVRPGGAKGMLVSTEVGKANLAWDAAGWEQGGSLGKINLQGAKDQSLRSFLPDDRDADQARDCETDTRSRSGGIELHVAAPTGAVNVETLSWMDAVKRKYDVL